MKKRVVFFALAGFMLIFNLGVYAQSNSANETKLIGTWLFMDGSTVFEFKSNGILTMRSESTGSESTTYKATNSMIAIYDLSNPSGGIIYGNYEISSDGRTLIIFERSNNMPMVFTKRN